VYQGLTTQPVPSGAAWQREPMDEHVARAAHPPDGTVDGRGLGRRALELVERLCTAGPRPQHGVGLANTRRLLRDALEDAGVVPYLGDQFEARDASGVVNLLGVVPGRERHLRPLLLATHYDGPPASPGAGDNAAAVALVVTLAPRLAAAHFERDVIVALLDGGDVARPPALPHGADVFMRSHRRHDLKAALLVDRIGHAVAAGNGPALLVVGVESEPRLPGVLDSIAALPGWLAPVARHRLGAAPAADVFRSHETPYLWITAGHAPHHRGGDDRPDRLDEATLGHTLDTVQALLAGLASTRLPGPYVDHDIGDLERRAWQRYGRGGDGAFDALRLALPRLDARGSGAVPD